MIADLSRAIALAATGTYTVTRREGPGYDERGREAAGTSTTFEVGASVQPLEGEELDRLPSGMRDREVRAVYVSSTTPLQNGGGTYEPDVIRLGADDWEVQQVADWGELGGFQRALVQRVGR